MHYVEDQTHEHPHCYITWSSVPPVCPPSLRYTVVMTTLSLLLCLMLVCFYFVIRNLSSLLLDLAC